MDEKLQYCEQKLQHLVQRVASLPAHSYSPDEDNEVCRGPVPALVSGAPHMAPLGGLSQGVLPDGRMEVTLGQGQGSAGHCGVPPSPGVCRGGTPLRLQHLPPLQQLPQNIFRRLL